MARQYLTQQFPAATVGGGGNPYANAVDFITLPGPLTSELTPGSTCIAQPTLLGPTVGQDWKLISVSIQSYLAFINYPDQAFGKLGKVVAGLMLDEELQPTNPNSLPIPLLPLPGDSSLITTLWDPATDSLPPVYLGGGTSPPPGKMLAVSGSIILNTPIEMYPGKKPSIGIWILPSLIGAQINSLHLTYVLEALVSSYTLNYDDGL